MNVIIFTNGDYTSLEFYEAYIKKINQPYIICADGGANFAKKLNIMPDIILGDMDSISRETTAFYRNVKYERYPVRKDKTDTELAINHAIKMGASEVTILGALGSRLDHSLGNIFLLTCFLDVGIKGKIVNEKNIIFLIKENETFEFPIGTVVSLLPIGGDVEEINISGFEYPIVNGRMTMNKPYGISNVVIHQEQKIAFEKGLLLVIISED
ncbi:thiamine diphosphokinase [Acetobacterium paludosum]|uniref:Thiamine diphosphokinase n=1 Tax=Acetobacterium paludosum TaxID=52693 RepID=A0A923KW34_9FIRM|nr:thiamine diphosphokinase [Acetobacterium paludosum]MBC3887628.1 thiamine diphosphokinase [Acetobacterium paludosum]